ncbi:polysaccharide biosynthesis C-terminal domain-containing protein [Pseudomonas sp. G2-4]|uniref:oligosaccharide flippase family protein n=1 Tax=Pseudomonas sp. G2-4 TaxID=1506334 RepID=UPI0024B8A447|nr:polysaccharide biosynthesis C-terminal domain-containing protein [Pseudomonas sp. G2-4]WHS62001.1 polysaccharide biosynthesis C-terminal domain-containing protein [Pseudomonas sp. G2-4]
MTAICKTLGMVFGYSSVLLVSKGLTLLVSYLVAFSVGNAEFGYFSLAQALFVTAVTLLGFNSSAAYVRYFYSKGVSAIYKALKRVYYLLFVLSVFFGLLLYFIFSGHPYFVWFALLPISGFLAAHIASFNAIYRCSNSLMGYAFAELGRPVLVFLSLAVFLWMKFEFSIVAVYLLALCASLLLVVFFSVFHFRSKLLNKSQSSLEEREVVVYLLPLVLVQLMALLNNVGDRYILSAFVTVDEIGKYGKAYLIGSAAGMLIDSFSLLWAPYVVRRVDDFKTDLYPKALLVFGGATFLSLLLLFGAGFVFIYEVSFFSFDYLFLVMAIIVLSAFMARVGYQIFVPVLSAYDLTGVVAKLSFVGAIGGIAANFALIPFWGGVGAAIATWISFSIFSMLSFWVVREKMLRV